MRHLGWLWCVAIAASGCVSYEFDCADQPDNRFCTGAVQDGAVRDAGSDAAMRDGGGEGGPDDGGPDASEQDGGTDAGPCGGECASTHCVGGVCVECTVATSGTDCLDETPVCDPVMNECVGCVVNGDCMSLATPECGVAQTCVGCEGNEACAGRAGTLACDDVSGACVECTETNTLACGGNACRPDGTCSAYPAGRFACEACDTDANCAAGHLCVELVFPTAGGAAYGQYCQWRKDATAVDGPNGQCANTREESQPWARELTAAMSVDGEVADVCTLRTTTCPGLLHHSQMVPGCAMPDSAGNAACGVELLNDGRCRWQNPVPMTNPRCTYPCLGNEDCPPGSSCPLAGDRYCSI